jgi:hypothetical protein
MLRTASITARSVRVSVYSKYFLGTKQFHISLLAMSPPVKLSADERKAKIASLNGWTEVQVWTE